MPYVILMKIVATQYLQGTPEAKVFSSFENFHDNIPKSSFLWLDVSDYESQDELKPLQVHFKLHSLPLEDCFHVRQRTKLENYEKYLFLVSRTVSPVQGRFTEGFQLGIFLDENFIITIHKDSIPQIAKILEDLLKIDTRSKKTSSVYLLYLILDSIVDGFEDAVGELEESESRIGCDVLKEKPSGSVLEQIYANRSSLILINRMLRNQSHVANQLSRKEFRIIKSETTPFFSDIHDHTLRTLERISSLLEMNMGSLSIYTSSVSNKMNEVMKLLTIISTIGVPLTVLVGWYGMNFREMPEIYWAYGYLTFILIAIGLMTTTVLLFRRKGWL
jgi:magnesium transporter